MYITVSKAGGKIGIYLEWNVKRVKDGLDRQSLPIGIYLEWNVKLYTFLDIQLSNLLEYI